MFSKYLLPPDVFIRHWLIAKELEKIPDLKSVLDVGGSLGEFRKFRDDLKVVTVDVIGGDVIYDGDRLPFKDCSFDAVVSIDTLEHIPPAKRIGLIGELARVAGKQLVIIAPYASVAHLEHEKKLKMDFETNGKAVPDYLKEHLRYGLVTQGQINEITTRYDLSSKLAGRVAMDNVNFLVHMFEIKQGKLNRIIYLMKFGWNLVINLFLTVIPMAGDRSNASRAILVRNPIRIIRMNS